MAGDKRAYYKTDVGYFDNPKIADLVEDNPRAVILHQRAIAYCAQHLTDGKFPVRLVMRMACASHSDLQCLLDRGLIHTVSDTEAEVHDYLEHQRSAAAVKKAKVAGQKGAAARWDTGADANRNANRIAKGNATPNSQRERKRDTSISSEVADATTRPDVTEILDYLDSKILENDPDRKLPKRTKRNIDAARLLIDKDGRTVEQIKAAIKYSQDDEFWRTNILSMTKLREKYEQLRLKAMQSGAMQRPQTEDRYANYPRAPRRHA